MELNQTLSHVWKSVSFESACPKFGVSLLIKLGPKTTYLRRLSTTLQLTSSDLMLTLTANVSGMKHDVDSGGTALEITNGLLHCRKIS